MEITMNFKEDTKRFNEISKNRVKCNCSHTFILTKKDRALCSHCGNWVYRTPEIEFKYKLKDKMKGKNND